MRDRAGGKRVRLPAAAERAWDWFWQLDRTRNGNGYSPNRITHQDIRALAGDRPAPWEVSAILEMDAVRLSLADSEGNADTTEHQTSGRTLTPALFKAFFSPE